MSGLSDSDLERLLRMRQAPRPPADLGARIRAEIPACVPVGEPESGSAGALVSPLARWEGKERLAALAAALVVAVTTGAIGLLPVGRVEERPVHRALLAPGDDDRAAIRVVGVAEPSASESAAARLVAIEVAVLDADETPRSGTRVAVEAIGTDRPAVEILTDRRGRAAAAGLPPGTYRVRCTPAAGAFAAGEVTLRAGEAAALLLVLPPPLVRASPMA